MENHTETAILGPGDIARAAQLLRAGRLVAMPTETVYGLAGDARNPESVAAIFAAKGRPAHNPLIVHLDQFGRGSVICGKTARSRPWFWTSLLARRR